MEKLLTTEEAALELTIPESTLRTQRCRYKGDPDRCIPYIKMGPRMVRYKKSVIDAIKETGTWH